MLGSMERNILSTLAYDGTGFKGWQRLPGAQRTVQECVEQALSKVLGRPTNVIGAGRTDAGVHAEGQAANFRAASGLELGELGALLNRELPGDIRCLALREAHTGFHARYRALDKTYAYRLALGRPGPGWRRYSLQAKGNLHLDAMAAACRLFPGERSFKAFTNAKADARGFVRSMLDARVERAGAFVDIIFKADGFLYNEARLLAAALLALGEGRLDESRLGQILDSEDRRSAPGALGAYGLRLVSIGYREEDFLGPEVAVPGLPPAGFLGGTARLG